MILQSPEAVSDAVAARLQQGTLFAEQGPTTAEVRSLRVVCYFLPAHKGISNAIWFNMLTSMQFNLLGNRISLRKYPLS